MSPVREKLGGHLLASVSIAIWGVTFIASKIMLEHYSPTQLIVIRFAISYIVLLCLSHKFEKIVWKDELRFFLLGLSGVSLYQMLENVALTYTDASNVSIIVAAAPILTALLAHIFTKDEKMTRFTLLGFVIAFSGVILVTLGGVFVFKLSPTGDLLSLAAALCWAIYSVINKSVVGRVEPLKLTRKTVFYGFITSLPFAIAEGKLPDLSHMLDWKMIVSLLILSVFGSGLCYVMWNIATKRLGTVTTNNYIYCNPFVTMIAAVLVLDEPVSLIKIGGAVLIILGVVISSATPKKKKADASAPGESTQEE